VAKRAEFMKMRAFGVSVFWEEHGARKAGFTLLELLTAIAIICIISAVAFPAVSALYGGCCVKAAIYELTGMLKEGKQNALSNGIYYGITFNTTAGIISLVTGKGSDGTWNTPDDPVLRSFRLADKGGGLRFGHGSYGPISGLVEAPDGVSFPNNNSCICNPNLTGNPGSVYIMSASGAAMALSMNTTDFGYKMYRWDGNEWVRM
jgi:prepilin-type N-terminal cleavage/methylation domain-containing protein